MMFSVKDQQGGFRRADHAIEKQVLDQCPYQPSHFKTMGRNFTNREDTIARNKDNEARCRAKSKEEGPSGRVRRAHSACHSRFSGIR